VLDTFQSITTTFADLAWGPWLLVLLLGGGLFFLIYSGFTPFRYLPHAFALLRGRYDDVHDPGQINHFKALSAALAGTIGMGNIAGVALAIKIGGPGAIFWMWVTAVIGIATKFFTCSLAVMYRGKDSHGDLQGGPMYVIREALPKEMHFLAYLFAFVAMIGCLPALQSNQLVQILRDLVFVDNGVVAEDGNLFSVNLALGIGLASVTAVVILGGLQRIARVASAVVPGMTLLYLAAVFVALAAHADAVPAAVGLILTDAFTGEAAAGGSLMGMMIYGVQRGAYSNEAGMGTESLAHGAARTAEPIREGLVAMLGPIVDTLLICTATALMILVSGAWLSDEAVGVTLTANAFSALLGKPGTVIIFVCVICFATTTILTYSFYGSQCTSFLFGVEHAPKYRIAYVAFIVLASVISIDAAVSLIDGCFALMAIPTMISTLWLAPHVKTAAAAYWVKLEHGTGPRHTA
jgi:AGCS family alanine or glycine:cation symporter